MAKSNEFRENVFCFEKGKSQIHYRCLNSNMIATIKIAKKVAVKFQMKFFKTLLQDI